MDTHAALDIAPTLAYAGPPVVSPKRRALWRTLRDVAWWAVRKLAWLGLRLTRMTLLLAGFLLILPGYLLVGLARLRGWQVARPVRRLHGLTLGRRVPTATAASLSQG